MKVLACTARLFLVVIGALKSTLRRLTGTNFAPAMSQVLMVMTPSNNDGGTLCFKVLTSKVVGLLGPWLYLGCGRE